MFLRLAASAAVVCLYQLPAEAVIYYGSSVAWSRSCRFFYMGMSRLPAEGSRRSAWVEKASEKAKLWFLLAGACSTLLPYYYQFVSPYVMGRLFLELLQYVVLFCRVQRYLLLGHYLRNHDWSLNKILLAGIPMFLIGYVVTFFRFPLCNRSAGIQRRIAGTFSLPIVLLTS